MNVPRKPEKGNDFVREWNSGPRRGLGTWFLGPSALGGVKPTPPSTENKTFPFRDDKNDEEKGWEKLLSSSPSVNDERITSEQPYTTQGKRGVVDIFVGARWNSKSVKQIGKKQVFF